jgi:hypothetical protein
MSNKNLKQQPMVFRPSQEEKVMIKFIADSNRLSISDVIRHLLKTDNSLIELYYSCRIRFCEVMEDDIIKANLQSYQTSNTIINDQIKHFENAKWKSEYEDYVDACVEADKDQQELLKFDELDTISTIEDMDFDDHLDPNRNWYPSGLFEPEPADDLLELEDEPRRIILQGDDYPQLPF